MSVVGDRISTDVVAPGERLRFWSDQVASLLTHLECSSELSDKFHGSIKVNSTRSTSLLELNTSAHRIARATPKLVQKGEEFVFVCLQEAGRAIVEQDGRQAILHPGDLTLLDTSQAFSATFPDELVQIVFQVPRKLIRQHVGALERLTATVVSGDSALGVMTGQFLRNFSREADRLRPPVAQRLSDQALDMVSMAFMSPMEERQQRSSLTRSALAYRGRAYIETKLRDPRLSPADVADHLGISKRYLNSVFSGDGLSVERFIRERRLQKCANELADSAQSIRPISDIAFAWGFSNLAHFSQTFKSVFGQTPRDYRKRAVEND